MKLQKTKSVFIVMLAFIFSVIDPSPAQAVVGGEVTGADCNTISGYVYDLDNPTRSVGWAVFVRAEDDSEDFLEARGSSEFNVSVPDSYWSSSSDTIYTVLADPYGVDQRTIVSQASLGRCGGSGGGGDDGSDPTPPTPANPPPLVSEVSCPVGATYCDQQDYTDQGGQLETGNIDVESNPFFTRLIQIINFLSVGVGIVITGSVIVAGIQYITSRGNPNLTQRAVSRLIQAGIALFLFIFGWALLNWLIPGGVINPAQVRMFLW